MGGLAHTEGTGSLIHDAMEYGRRFEKCAPPRIDDPAFDGHIATLYPNPDLDELIDRAASVTILQVDRPFNLRAAELINLVRSHPRISGLLAFKPVPVRTISMLPNLQFIMLSTLQNASEAQGALPASLQELWASPLDLDRLSSLPRLRFLHTTLTSGRAEQCRALSKLSALRVLRLESAKPLSGVEALGGLENLEEISIDRVARFDLRGLRGCRSLTTMNLSSSVELDGIEGLSGLRALSLDGRRAVPLAPLKGLPRLEALALGYLQAPPDLDVVGELAALRHLSLAIGSASSPFTLAGTRLFANLKELETLDCQTLFTDTDLTPLAGLKNLKYVCFLGAFPEERVEWLQKQLPHCKLDLTTGKPPVRPPEVQFGLLSASDVGGRWTVFQDLRLVLGKEDNHDAEDAVKAHLERANPQLLQRLEFDSEADGFSFYAKSPDDVRAVAAAIEALTKQ
jgi:hypothetical protein